MRINHLKCKTLLIPLFLWFTIYSYSQTTQDFNLGFKINTLLTPASLDTTNHYHIDFVTNTNSNGLLSNFNSNYLSLSLTNLHFKAKIGLQILSQKEGDFFRRNKIFINFSKSIRIDNKNELKLGIALGVTNYYFSPSKASPGGSDFALDGNWGISYQSKKFLMDIGMYQFLNSTLTPLDYQFRLNPIGFWRIGFCNQINQYWSYTLWSLFLIETSNNNITIAPELKYKDIGSFGLGYANNKGLMFFIGTEKLSIGSLQLNLHLSYYFFDFGTSGAYYSPKEVYFKVGN